MFLLNKILLKIYSPLEGATVCTRVMRQTLFVVFNYIYCSRYLFIVLCFVQFSLPCVHFNDVAEDSGRIQIRPNVVSEDANVAVLHMGEQKKITTDAYFL